VEALEERTLLSVSPASGIGLLNPIAAEYDLTASEYDAYHTNVQTLLGAPTSGVTSVPGVAGAQMETYQHGTIYYSWNSDAHVIYGDVAVKYRSLGGPAGFGLPYSDEAAVPGVPGVRVTNFSGGRSIYWSAATGSHVVLAGINDEYKATAGEKDAYDRVVRQLLGAPTSDEVDAPGVPGARMNTFTGGTIYWSPDRTIGTHVVYGGIAGKYASLGGSGSTLVAYTTSGGFGTGVWNTPGYGLPTSDEAATSVPGVRMQTFGSGTIYWSGKYGAFALSQGASSPIGAEYAHTGLEDDVFGNNVQNDLGAPRSDDTNVPGVPGARQMLFDGGAIYWSPNTYGAHAVYGAIAAKYNSLSVGGPGGSLGLPTSEEFSTATGGEQYFQYGKILSLPQGTVAIWDTPSMTFDSGSISFPDGTPVGGWVHMTVSADGSYDITGHFHNSGFIAQAEKLVVVLIAPSGKDWYQTYEGTMAGTLGSGSRNDDFELKSKAPDATLAANWKELEGSFMRTAVTVGDDWGSVMRGIGDGVKTAAQWVAKYVKAATGATDDPPPDDNGDGTGGSTVGSPDVSSDASISSFRTAISAWGVYAHPVTLDASALGVPSVSLDGVPRDASAPIAAKLYPGAHTLSTNGKDFTAFTVNSDGTISYDPALEGALTGSGTTALAVHGYTVALDATALGVPVLGLDNLPIDGTAPTSANLLPGRHTLTTNGTDAITFTVNPDGTVTYDSTLEGALTGSGTTALAVHGYAVTLDATALGVISISVDGVVHDATAPFSVNLLPGQHSLSATGNDTTSFAVNADGTISYDPSLEGALTGGGTRALAVNGYAVTLDASALGVPSLWLDGAAYDASASLSVNLLPGQHSLSTDGTNVIWFTVNADGTVSYDPALEGLLTGSGTTSLVLQAP
jgi:hypothetical protein